MRNMSWHLPCYTFLFFFDVMYRYPNFLQKRQFQLVGKRYKVHQPKQIIREFFVMNQKFQTSKSKKQCKLPFKDANCGCQLPCCMLRHVMQIFFSFKTFLSFDIKANNIDCLNHDDIISLQVCWQRAISRSMQKNTHIFFHTGAIYFEALLVPTVLYFVLYNITIFILYCVVLAGW